MAKRRSRGEGTIYQRKDGLWAAQITTPDGKRKTKYSKRQKEVQDWLLKERSLLKDGIYIPDDKLTVEQYLELYLRDYAKESVRASTYRSYSNMMHWHIIPEIGHIKLIKLDAKTLNALYQKKRDEGLSARSVEYIHGLLKRSLNKAVEWGILKFNPTFSAVKPKLEKKAPATWTAQQAKKFLDHIKDDRWAAVYYLAMVGMREGEILALRENDLDLTNTKLKVTQTIQFIQGQGLVFSEPKTAKSRRLVLLPGFVVAALSRHVEKQAVLKQGEKWQENGLVFTTNIGTPISPRNLIRHFKHKTEEYGLPEIRFHDLRHSTATLLLERNCHPAIVANLLGHSSPALTLSVYSHVTPTIQQQAIDELNKIFS